MRGPLSGPLDLPLAGSWQRWPKRRHPGSVPPSVRPRDPAATAFHGKAPCVSVAHRFVAPVAGSPLAEPTSVELVFLGTRHPDSGLSLVRVGNPCPECF